MCMYSVWLTLIVVASLPVYAIVSALLVPAFRARLNEKFARGADNQSFLVESISGVETVKAMAVEPQFIRRWESQLAAYVSAGFQVNQLGNVGQQLIQFIGKLVSLGTLFIGAKLVIDGRLSVGELVAFNMMSQRVSTPVLRLAQLWQDFQQIGISMLRLGDILNTRTEIPRAHQALPPIRGDVQFESVRFRYRRCPARDRWRVLPDPSGQGHRHCRALGLGQEHAHEAAAAPLHSRAGPCIDGQDLALADPAWLRRQIGVVLQENLLFNRSVRENIALGDPGVPLEAVMRAAQLAGAHEFILRIARRLRHRRGRARRQPVGRAASAPRHCAGAAH